MKSFVIVLLLLFINLLPLLSLLLARGYLGFLPGTALSYVRLGLLWLSSLTVSISLRSAVFSEESMLSFLFYSWFRMLEIWLDKFFSKTLLTRSFSLMSEGRSCARMLTWESVRWVWSAASLAGDYFELMPEFALILNFLFPILRLGFILLWIRLLPIDIPFFFI